MTRPSPTSMVVGLDIDGTLGRYHEHFTNYIRLYTGRDIEWNNTLDAPFHRQLGVSKALYRQTKLAYRQGGAKRWMPAFDGAEDLVRGIRSQGVRVYICTTRPYLQLGAIDGDTRHWLRRNGMLVDGILWGQHKYRDLVAEVGREKVLAVLDDDLSQIGVAEELGLKAIMRRNEANLHYIPRPSQPAVSSLKEALDEINMYIEMDKRAGKDARS